MDERLKSFLERFDAYVDTRAKLRKAADDSDEAELYLAQCASLWGELCRSRAAVSASGESK